MVHAQRTYKSENLQTLVESLKKYPGGEKPETPERIKYIRKKERKYERKKNKKERKQTNERKKNKRMKEI